MQDKRLYYLGYIVTLLGLDTVRREVPVPTRIIKIGPYTQKRGNEVELIKVLV